MNRKFIVGNWKMYTTAREARQLVKAIVDGSAVGNDVSVAVCPPFPYLALVGEILAGSSIALGAQNFYPENQGAFTGEVSPTMLLDLGCKYAIVGHSERGHVLGESDAFINRKIRFALEAGLKVIFCIGETLAEREGNQTEAVLDHQLKLGLDRVSVDSLSNLSIAYEPVWAIGKLGHHATPQQAQEAHTIIRRCFALIFDEKAAQSLIVQYGGSVKPINASELLSRRGVDGALIGGASLNAEQFLSIVRTARSVQRTESVGV